MLALFANKKSFWSILNNKKYVDLTVKDFRLIDWYYRQAKPSSHEPSLVQSRLALTAKPRAMIKQRSEAC
jgi:hypothetical protein